MALQRLHGSFFAGLFGAVLMVAGMSSASAGLITDPVLDINDIYYVGSINDGIPSSPSDEVEYINALIALTAGTGPFTCALTETCDRTGSTLLGTLSSAVLTNSFKDETANPAVDITGSTYQYILGKYDAKKAGSLVWYNADGFTGNITLPAKFNNQGISHISGFNLADGSIPFIPMPEPGALSLLGVGLLGLGLSRRRIRS